MKLGDPKEKCPERKSNEGNSQRYRETLLKERLGILHDRRVQEQTRAIANEGDDSCNKNNRQEVTQSDKGSRDDCSTKALDIPNGIRYPLEITRYALK